MAFPTSPTDGQIYGKYRYNTAKGAWEKISLSDLKSTSTSLGISDELFPTQNAVKTYVDSNTIKVQTLTADPSSPVLGEIWLRSDL